MKKSLLFKLKLCRRIRYHEIRKYLYMKGAHDGQNI